MEQMQWFLMGVLFTLSVFALAWLSVIVKLQWYIWGGMITAVLLILFGIGWAGAHGVDRTRIKVCWKFAGG